MDNPNDKKNVTPEEPFAGGGGGTVDDLTPPTMKYGPGGAPQSGSAINEHTLSLDAERTRLGPTQISPNKPVTTTSGASHPGTAPTLGGHNVATIVGDIIAQDLSTEKLLRDAPRVESSGKLCPSLNGIPLLAKLGQGGMGAVYYGIHPRLRSEVAVKVLPFHLAAQDPGMIQRFFREAQIAAKVRSPHLVSVIDVNEESGLFFLVMEYVSGVTMGQYIKQLAEKGSVGMPELDTIDACIAACMGLSAAHQHGIVHRDLKPENIMVPYKSRQQKTYDLKHSKLMDLGLARSEEGQQSLTGGQAAMGTPGYMAPEQALDAKTADKRSDVFGMGATIYALLCGHAPFKGDAVMKVLMATMHEPHEPIGAKRPDISAALAEVIDCCLDKRPENRYADANQLMRALKNCRKLIAPDSSFAGEDEGEDTQIQTGAIPASSMPRGTAAPNLSAAKPGASYARAGSTANRTAVASPPAKSKLPLIAGAGACALLALGAVGYFAWPKREIVVEIPQKPPVEKKKTDPARLEYIKSKHATAMDDIRKSIREGDITEAGFKLEDALVVAAPYLDELPQLKQDHAELRLQIDAAKKHSEFVKTLKEIDGLLVQDNVAKARELILSAKELSDADTGLRQEKLVQIERQEKEVERKNKFSTFLGEARKGDAPLDKRLAAVDSALEMFAGSPEAQQLKQELRDLKMIEDNETRYKANFAKAGADLNKKDYDSAKNAIDLALEVKPKDEAALKLNDQIMANLGQAAKTRLEQKAKAEKESKFLAAYAEAEKLLKDQNGIEAEKAIARALALDETNGNANLLSKQISVLAQKQRDALELKRKQEEFAGLVKTATGLLATDFNLDEAISLANRAAKIDIDKATADQAAALVQKIKERQTYLIQREKYDNFVSSAKQLLKEAASDLEKDKNLERADDTAKKLTAALNKSEEALRIDETPGPALKVRESIVAKRNELNNKIEIRRRNVEAYEKAVTDGDAAMKKNSFEEALAAYKGGKTPADSLTITEQEAIKNKTAKAQSKVDDLGKVNAALASAKKFGDEENYDEAIKQLVEAARIMNDPRIDPAKAVLAGKKSELDTLAAKALGDAVAEYKAGKAPDAIAALKKAADEHKNRRDLANAAAALTTLRQVDDGIRQRLVGLRAAYDRLSGQLNGQGNELKQGFNSAATKLDGLALAYLGKFAEAGFPAPAVLSDEIKAKQGEYLAEADKYLAQMQALATQLSRPVTPPPSNNNNNSGGNRSNDDRPPKE